MKPPPKRATFIFFIVLAWLAFYTAYRCGFVVYDDAIYVYQNPKILSLDPAHLKAIFLHPHAFGYTPLPLLTYAVEFAIGGLDPALYHATNILLHGIAGFTTFLLLRRCGLSSIAAWLAACLFTVHPLQAESVAWISIRKGLLSLLFFNLSAFFFMQPPSARDKWNECLSVICFALSMLSMMYAILLPGIFLAAERLGIRQKRPIEKHAPFWALSWVTILIWMNAHPASGHASGSLPSPDRLLPAAQALLFYLAKLTWPSSLSVFYPRPEPSFIPLLVSAVLMAGFWGVSRSTPIARLGACYFILALIPILPFFDHTHSATQDHYAYLASVGFFMTLASFFDRWMRSSEMKRCATILLGSLLVVHWGLLSQRQCRSWKDTVHLAENTIRLYPNLAPAYFIRGEHYRAAGLTNEALLDFDRAIELRPDVFVAYEYRSRTLRESGRIEEAREDLARSLRLQADPAHRRVY